jgi:hypothetical protein
MTTPNEKTNLPIVRPADQPADLVRRPGRVAYKAAEQVDQHDAQADELQYAAEHVMDTPVRGVRGGVLTVAAAKDTADELREQIDHEEASGSLRHRLAKRFTKWTVWLVVVLIDFPIMLWACSSVFNVDWTDPWGVRLLFSVAAAVLATLASAAALHHLGRELREHKTEGRGLAWRTLPARSKGVVITVMLLVVLVALLMFARVYTEGVLSGLQAIALLLAILVAFVMLISASLVFWTAFRDGSPETDDLGYYTTLVEKHLHDKRRLEARASDHKRQAELIRRRAERAYWRTPPTP